MVMINSGGAPGVGVPASPVPPMSPIAAAIAATTEFGFAGRALKGMVAAGSAPMSPVAGPEPPTHNPTSEENKDKTSWIEIQLEDEAGKPVPGETYRVTLPDGSVSEGTLDEKGLARVDNIDPGNCLITFPNLDKQAWKPK